MKISEVIKLLEILAPPSTAEEFDNVGLLVGSSDQEIEGVLITLDCIESVVDEAISKNCNLIVTFHPIIFSGLKSITGKNYVERTVIKAIQNNISIYAIHTNLDIAKEGVNFEICKRLNLINTKPLLPKVRSIKKLQTYVPINDFYTVQKALFDVGAGEIGKYKNCSFRVEGKGSFLPTGKANPVIGKLNKLEEIEEMLLSVIFEDYKEFSILEALKRAHPYEEVAYEVYLLENQNQEIGMGRIGEFMEEMSETNFLNNVKEVLPTSCIRHTLLLNKKIKTVAVLGGSGSFAIKNAISQKADAFITADLKYHDFFQAEGKIVLIDVGHYESEQFTKNLLYEYLKANIETTFVTISEINTNPVHYFT